MRSQRLREAFDVCDQVRSEREGHLAETLFGDWTDPASASERWMALAREAVRNAALERDFLTTENVRWPDDPTVDRRAHGAILQGAVRDGVIQSTDSFVGGGASRHGRPLRVFRSQVYAS